MSRSWHPAPNAGAGWVHVRPLRQPAHPRGNHPADPFATPPQSQKALPRSPSSAAAYRRQARSSSPLRGCGRSSWTPDRATAQTGSDEESHNNSPQPGRPRATGHRVRPPRLLTAKAPMGASMPVVVAVGSQYRGLVAVRMLYLMFVHLASWMALLAWSARRRTPSWCCAKRSRCCGDRTQGRSWTGPTGRYSRPWRGCSPGCCGWADS
jgi:hypothetical protein